jgi:hypothetical protein
MRNFIVTAALDVFGIFVLALITCIFSFLSKVDISYFVLLSLFVAIATLLLYPSYIIGKFNHDLQGKRGRYHGGPVFWVLICNFSLPIILAHTSSVLKVMGFIDVSKYVFENRFIVVLWSTITLIILYLISIITLYLYKRFQRKMSLRIVENGCL